MIKISKKSNNVKFVYLGEKEIVVDFNNVKYFS